LVRDFLEKPMGFPFKPFEAVDGPPEAIHPEEKPSFRRLRPSV
jgi:hypothetical protein